MSRLFEFVKRNKIPLVLGAGVLWGAQAVDLFSPRPNETFLARHDRVNNAITTARGLDSFKVNQIPTRPQILDHLRQVAKQDIELDVIVIGGGATGSGVALDAVSRGMSVALFERADFSSGTSSRSTKLIHGGIRYLESAIMNLDIEDLHLVKEALSERSNLLNNAPHLSHPLPIAIPVYSWIELPKMWIGTKMYDFFYPGHEIPRSHYVSKETTMGMFPYLKDGLLGSIIYYDGQHNDARMNLSIALSAAQRGASALNYAEVQSFVKHPDTGKITGVVVRDRMTGEVLTVRAKCVVNATGPFSDNIRKIDDPSIHPIVAGAAGVHLILPKHLCPPDMGFLNPKTKDGRILFILPFEGNTIAGTTDQPSSITYSPKPNDDEVDFILDAISQYSKDSNAITRKDVLAAWSGIRPLVKKVEGNVPTSKINRHHTILSSPSEFKIEKDIASHLAHSYGDQAVYVLKLAKEKNLMTRLANGYPYIEAEVEYGVREYACTAEDIIARRTRLAFLDNAKSLEALPRIVDLMAPILGWDKSKKAQQLQETTTFLSTMRAPTTSL
eukprot:gene10784-12564_t